MPEALTSVFYEKQLDISMNLANIPEVSDISCCDDSPHISHIRGNITPGMGNTLMKAMYGSTTTGFESVKKSR